jgi:hypothetical protein
MTAHHEGCACCGKVEAEMFLHSKCHTGWPMWAAMTQAGILILRCAQCEKEVARFEAEQIIVPPTLEAVQ